MSGPMAGVLPCLALSAVLGILSADHGGLSIGAAGGVAGVATLLALVIRKRPLGVAACAAVVLGSLCGAVHAQRLALAARDAPTGTFDAVADGTVRGLRGQARWVVLELHDVVPVPFGARPAPRLPARLKLVQRTETPEGAWLSERAEGERIRAWLRLRPGGGLRNPGTPDRTRSNERRGIGGLARLIDVRLATRLDGSRRPGLRARLAQRLLAAGAGGELLAALALGDRSGMGPEIREAFRRCGISHLLAVSGLHLLLVAALGFALVRFLAHRSSVLLEVTDVRVWACIGAGLAAVSYGLLAGWGVPVRRAAVFVLVSLVALGLRRVAAPGHALSAAVLCIAVFDPAAIFELGPQLSFVAAAALLWDRSPARGRWASRLRVSATVIAATAPVLAAHGVESTPLGLLANLLAVPWTGMVLLPASLCAVSLAWLEPTAFSNGLLAVCTWVARISLEVVLAVAGPLPAPPAAPTGWLGVTLAAAIAALSLGVRRTGLRVFLAASGASLGALLPADSIGPDAPRLVVFEVGLGDAILVETRDSALLVDAGWGGAGGADLGRSVVLPALRSLGIERLDALVATHADLDHSGGLASVLEGLPVAELWLPGGRSSEFGELRSLARRFGVKVLELDARVGSTRRAGFDVEILWPPADGRHRSRNDDSLVFRINVAGTRILLTGDIGAATERALLASRVDLRSDVLKLPHHGSRQSATLPFLEAVGAEIALLSAPCSARSRLPSPEAIERAGRAGMSVWWTGRDGALWVQLRRAPIRRVVWGWRRDPHCRLPVSLSLGEPRRT